MTSYFVVIRNDEAGIPRGETFFLDKEGDTLAVLALLKNPTPQKQVKVNNLQGTKLNIRSEPREGSMDLGDALNGTVYPALELATDADGNQWVRIDMGKWIVRIYHGIVKAEFV